MNMHGRYRGMAPPPPPMGQKQTGPLGTMANFALQQGLQKGLDMYAPGSGTILGGALRAGAGQMLPRFNSGGRVQADTFGAPAVYREEGGNIHIAKDKEGVFTKKAESAGMGVQEYARKVLGAPEGRYDPATRKQANFARNATKWHNMGGRVEADTFGAPANYKQGGGMIEGVTHHKMPDGSMMAGASHSGRQGADTFGAPAVYKNMGGPLGGGQTEAALKEARSLGALTQKEFLKAMEHGGYLKGSGPLAGVKYKQTGGKITNEAEVKFHNPMMGKADK